MTTPQPPEHPDDAAPAEDATEATAASEVVTPAEAPAGAGPEADAPAAEATTAVDSFAVEPAPEPADAADSAPEPAEEPGPVAADEAALHASPEQPVVDSLAAEEPVSQEPAPEEPVSEEPAAEEPAPEEPTTAAEPAPAADAAPADEAPAPAPQGSAGLTTAPHHPALHPAADLDADADPDPEATEGAATSRPRRAWLPLTAVGLAVALLAGTAGALTWQLRQQARADAAGVDAVAAARDAARLLFSYDHQTLQADFAEGLAATTGDFREQYQRTTRDVVSPVATQYKAVVQAEVVEAAVVSARPDEVVALVFLNQATTSTRVQGQQVDQSRVRMRLVPRGGRWLVEEVKAL